MNMFHTRQTNILCLYIINLSVCTYPPSAPSVNWAFSIEGMTQCGPRGPPQALPDFSWPPLLSPCCYSLHLHSRIIFTLAVTIMWWVCVFVSSCLCVRLYWWLPFPLYLKHHITAGMNTACLCETSLSQEKWEQRAGCQCRTETSLFTHNISIRRYLDAWASVCVRLCAFVWRPDNHCVDVYREIWLNLGGTLPCASVTELR